MTAEAQAWAGLDPYPPFALLTDNRAAMSSFDRVFARRRRAAHAHYLKPNDTLSLTPISLHPYAVSVAKVSEFEEKRRHALLRRLDSQPPASLSVDLVAAVEEGGGLFAQVWRVDHMADSGPPRLLKIYDDGLYPEQDELDTAPNDGSQQPWQPSPYAASNEAWGYEHLKSLQGTIIPRSYGFFQMKLPAGYMVAGHLLEELPGVPLSDWIESSPSREERWRAADQVLVAVHALHLLDVQHGDLDCRHLFLQTDASIRLCDLGFAKLVDPDSEPPRRRFVTDTCGIYDTLNELLGKEQERVLHQLVRTFEGHEWMGWYSEPESMLELLRELDCDVGVERDYVALERDPDEWRRICAPAAVIVS